MRRNGTKTASIVRHDCAKRSALSALEHVFSHDSLLHSIRITSFDNFYIQSVQRNCHQYFTIFFSFLSFLSIRNRESFLLLPNYNYIYWKCEKLLRYRKCGDIARNRLHLANWWRNYLYGRSRARRGKYVRERWIKWRYVRERWISN